MKGRILEERIVEAIRFPVIIQKEFAEVMLDSDILTRKELSGMMKYFSSLLTFPDWCSETSRRGTNRAGLCLGTYQKSGIILSALT